MPRPVGAPITCFCSGFVLADGQKQGEKGGLKVTNQAPPPAPLLQERESCFQLSAPWLPSPTWGLCVALGQLGFLLRHMAPASKPVLKDLLRTGSFLGAFIRDFSWLSSPIEKWEL